MRCRSCKRLECTQPFELCESDLREQEREQLKERLRLAEAKNELYRTALETLKRRHFPNVKPSTHVEVWENGRFPVPGTSAWQDSREAFALLDEKYLQKRLKER